MEYYHYFPETNFFINYPNFNKYLFDTNPYTVVISRAVMVELDLLKKPDPESPEGNNGRDSKAREASRTIEDVQTGKLPLLNCGKLIVYSKRANTPKKNFDEEIESLVNLYLSERKKYEKVVFLTGDRNLRILSRRNESLVVADPRDWQIEKLEEQKYSQGIKQIAEVDEQVNLAHKARLRIEEKLIKIWDTGEEETINKLNARLIKAKQREKKELERFENQRKLAIEKKELERLENQRKLESEKKKEIERLENQRKLENEKKELERLENQHKLESEKKKELERLENQHKLEIEKKRQEQLASRNKYIVTLSDFQYGEGKKVLRVLQSDLSPIGVITVEKYWRYTYYPNLFSTVHLSARIAGQVFPLVVISVADRPLYILPDHPLYPSEIKGNYWVLYPPKHKNFEMAAGSWKIALCIEDVAFIEFPLLPNGARGKDPIFNTLTLKINASEITPDEAEKINQNLSQQNQPQTQSLTVPETAKKHSIIGIASFFLSIVSSCLLCLALTMSLPQIRNVLLGNTLFCINPILSLTGIILGTGNLFQKNYKKGFGITGIVINIFLLILGVVIPLTAMWYLSFPK